jgi:hypothetical protein
VATGFFPSPWATGRYPQTSGSSTTFHNKFITVSNIMMRFIYGDGQNNGYTKNLWNRICVGHTERTLVCKTRCSSSVCLHSVVLVQCISDCVEWQWVWNNRKMGELSDSERWQIVSARLAGASVTKTATLFGVSRATVSEVMLAYTNHGKPTSAKRNSGGTPVGTPKASEHRLVPG